MSGPMDITPSKDKGVLKEILQAGVGNELPPPGCNVKVHYTGTFTDGTKFDSSRDRNEPLNFGLGKGHVIKALDIGVATMRKGERAMLTCAPEYAYGRAGYHRAIPPDSVLKFDVELIDWQGQDLSPKEDGGIERLQVTQGEGNTHPGDGAVVEVHIVGKYQGNTFDDRNVTFTLGEGSEADIIPGIEHAIGQFMKNETSHLIIKPQYAFGSTGRADYNVPPNATVVYKVTLRNFENPKLSWFFDPADKIEQAKLFKERGTAYFKAGKYDLALTLYNRILDFLEFEKDSEVEEEKNALLLASHLNIALCQLKLNNYLEAKTAATSALEIDPANEKALFRRGQALVSMGEPTLATEDFSECLKIDPNNSAAKAQLAICSKTLKEKLQKEKNVYANMFDKFAKMDTQREEFEKKKQPNVMSSVGEWGQEDREREPSEFEKENPDILLLNRTGQFKDM